MRRKYFLFFALILFNFISFSQSFNIFFGGGTFKSFVPQTINYSLDIPIYEKIIALTNGKINYSSESPILFVFGLEKELSGGFGVYALISSVKEDVKVYSLYTVKIPAINFRDGFNEMWKGDIDIKIANVGMFKRFRVSKKIVSSIRLGFLYGTLKNELKAYYGLSAKYKIEDEILFDYFKIDVFNDESFSVKGANIGLSLSYRLNYNLGLFIEGDYFYLSSIETNWITKPGKYNGELGQLFIDIKDKEFLTKIGYYDTSIQLNPSFYFFIGGIKIYF